MRKNMGEKKHTIKEEKEFYARIPRKRAGGGVVFLNKEDKILLVKPSYRDYWLFPGGIVEKDESPREGAIRETKEEIDLDAANCRLVSVDYVSDDGIRGDAMQFLFYGGILSEKDIKNIKLDNDEIVEYKFMNIKEATEKVSRKTKTRLINTLKAIKNNSVVYLENGEL